MTAAVVDRPGSLFADAAERAGAGAAPGDGERLGGGNRHLAGGRVRLEELLNATLHAAHTNGSAECPACRAQMTFTRAGAECRDCGSRLT